MDLDKDCLELSGEIGEVCNKFFKEKRVTSFDIILELQRWKVFYILQAVKEEELEGDANEENSNLIRFPSVSMFFVIFTIITDIIRVICFVETTDFTNHFELKINQTFL